jgi:hypothetical protein
MNGIKHGTRFWTGNAILAVGLVALFYMDPLSEILGVWAMVLWMALAGAGVFFLTTDKGGPTGMMD